MAYLHERMVKNTYQANCDVLTQFSKVKMKEIIVREKLLFEHGG